MLGEAFAITSLQDRSFRSTLAFFFADELVLCSFDVFQALWRAFQPDQRYADVAAWCAATRAEAEHVVVIPDREIERVRVTFRMMQHELWVARERGGVAAPAYRAVLRHAPLVHRFLVLDRGEAEPATHRLARRFGARFELASSRPYGFVHHRAPWLTR
jgi:hypothetical protein